MLVKEYVARRKRTTTDIELGRRGRMREMETAIRRSETEMTK